MCTINDDDYENGTELLSPEDSGGFLNNETCKKCHSEDVLVLLRNKDSYCKNCFLTNTTHKFRAALGKSKIIHRGDVILIDHSSKTNSSVLLHLIKSGMNEAAHKKLIFKTIVLYIDESCIKNKSIKERESMLENIGNEVNSYGFPAYTVSLDQVLDESSIEIQEMNATKTVRETNDSLSKLFNGMSDCTAKKDLLYQLRQKLLVLAAQKLGCNKIFVAESKMDLAVKILSNISLGRGAHLSFDVGFSDIRNTDIMILRPLQDFSSKEIAYYLKFHDLSLLPDVEKSSPNSIQDLTECFVNNLDSEFCGTVSTVFKTGEKLCAEKSILQSFDNNCVLCNLSLDTSLDVPSALQAILFSKLMSQKRVNSDCNEMKIKDPASDSDMCNDCSCGKNKTKPLTSDDIQENLCYGCRSIFRNIDNINCVPPFVLRTVSERISLKNMQKEISEFLL